MERGSRLPRGGPWLVLLAAVLWGTTGTAQQFAPPGATPWAIGALRLLVGGTALWSAVHVQDRLQATPGGGRAGDAGKRRRWHPALLGAAVGVAGYQAAFFAGVARTGVATGTLVTIGSAPIWAGLLEMVVLKEKPSLRWAGATALAVLGSALLVGVGRDVDVDPGGVWLTLAAGASFALYTVSNKVAVRHFPPGGHHIVATALLWGGLALLPVVLWSDTGWLWQWRGALVVLHLGLVATAVPYALFGRGLVTVSAASATTLTLAEPLTAALLGMTLLGERLPSPVGAMLVFTALLVLARGMGPARAGTTVAKRE